MTVNDWGFGNVEAELFRLIFLMARCSAALAAAPIFGAVGVPLQLRLVLTGSMAVFVMFWVPVATPTALLSVAGLLALSGEVVVGFALGLVLQIAFAAPVLAAEVIAGSMGIAMATAVDPNSGSQSGVLGQYFNLVLTLIFLGLGGHLLWLRLVIESYRALPPGGAGFGDGALLRIAGFAGEMLATAAAIALPVALALLLVQIVTGALSRSAPALNLFALGLPAGVMAGLVALIAATPLLHDQLVTLSVTVIEQTGSILQQ